MEKRFWIMLVDDDSQPRLHAGWWGVVDEAAGGIVSCAATQDTAQIIRDALASHSYQAEHENAFHLTYEPQCPECQEDGPTRTCDSQSNYPAA